MTYASFPTAEFSLMFFSTDASLYWVCVALQSGQRTAYLWCFFSLKSTGWCSCSKTEVRAGWSPKKLRLTLTLASSFWISSTACGSAFGLEGGKKKTKERERNEMNGGKGSLCTRIKEPGTKHITLHFCHIQLASNHTEEKQQAAEL